MPILPVRIDGDGNGNVSIEYAERITVVPGFEGKLKLNRLGEDVDITLVSQPLSDSILVNYDSGEAAPTTYLNSGYFGTAIALTDAGEPVAPFAQLQDP